MIDYGAIFGIVSNTVRQRVDLLLFSYIRLLRELSCITFFIQYLYPFASLLLPKKVNAWPLHMRLAYDFNDSHFVIFETVELKAFF